MSTTVTTKTWYSSADLHRIPDHQVRAMATELMALWPAAAPGIPFPGYVADLDQFGQGFNFYINGEGLSPSLPPMARNSSKCPGTTVYRGDATWHYGYKTVTIRTAWSRARRGLPLFLG